jgi:hypothetical protein
MGEETMSSSNPPPLTSLLDRLLPRLKYPQLFLILAGLFVVDLLVPDPIPFVDETALALLTFLVGSWRTRKQPPKAPSQPPRDVTAEGSDGPPRSSRDEDPGA